MSEAKFTPGPWTIWDKHYAVYAGVSENTPGCISGKELKKIADCEDAYDDGEMDHCEAEANTRLIAAAPDLYDACQFALNTLMDWDRDDGEAGEALRAAIAKATT